MDTAQMERQVVEILDEVHNQIVGIATKIAEPSNTFNPALTGELAQKLLRVGQTMPQVSTWVEQILTAGEGSKDRKLAFATIVSHRFVAIKFCIEQLNGLLLLRNASPVPAALLN